MGRNGEDRERLDSFLDRLRLALEITGKSQSELARQLDVRAATVSDWFNQARAPNGLVMLQLPTLLDVDASWLFTGEGSPRGQRKLRAS